MLKNHVTEEVEEGGEIKGERETPLLVGCSPAMRSWRGIGARTERAAGMEWDKKIIQYINTENTINIAFSCCMIPHAYWVRNLAIFPSLLSPILREAISPPLP